MNEDYCGCCGGDATKAPKGEHSTCCNEQHDVAAVTECVNCRWTADSGLSHDDYVRANRMMAWLCTTPPVGPIVSIHAPRPENADPVFSADGTVIGYSVR